MRKIATTDELQHELRQILDYASSLQPSRALLASELQQLSVRVAMNERVVTAKMDQDKLIQMFDSLKPKQKVKVSLRAVMGHGDSENGTPTEYIVGRRSKSRFSENVALLPADGSKPHPLAKKTLMKRKDHEGNTYVTVALGDMGATLISLEHA